MISGPSCLAALRLAPCCRIPRTSKFRKAAESTVRCNFRTFHQRHVPPSFAILQLLARRRGFICLRWTGMRSPSSAYMWRGGNVPCLYAQECPLSDFWDTVHGRGPSYFFRGGHPACAVQVRF